MPQEKLTDQLSGTMDAHAREALGDMRPDGGEVPERYPFIVRLYGVLAIIAVGVQIVALVLTILGLVTGSLEVESAAATNAAITLVVEIVSLVLSSTLSIMFLILGIRLLRGKRRRVALLANVMIFLEVGNILCQVMLTGINSQLIAPIVNTVILIMLQTYSDPALADERRLQRKLQQYEIRAQAQEGTLGLDQTGKGYITLNFFNVFWVFVICCVIGVAVETIYHMVVVDPGVYEDRAGMLYGPFSPIYGFGAVLMTCALNRFHDKNPLIIFLVSAVIGGAFEFFVSWFLESAFGITAWDYTGTFLSIGGRTNGQFMAMWGVMGLIWIKWCLPLMLNVVNKIPWNWRYAVTTVCTALMVADGVLTLASLDCWYQRQAGTMDYANQSAIVAFCNEHYTDSFMDNRFQSMSMDTSHASRMN